MVSESDEPLLSEWRIKMYARVVFSAFAMAFVLFVVTSDGSRALTGVLGGDMPAFYSAGAIVARGDGARLYDWDLQAASQAGLFGDDTESFLPFAYPPQYAAFFVPFSWIPFQWSYALHTFLMGLLLYAAFGALASTHHRLSRYRFEAFVVALSFFPMLSAVGGQNTALTAALAAGVWWALRSDRDVVAGLLAGLMLFKPQFGIPLIGLVLLRRPFPFAPAVIAMAGLHYLVGAIVTGWDWPVVWWNGIAQLHAIDRTLNAANSVGIFGFSEAFIGARTAKALAVGITGTAALIAGLMWASVRVPAVDPWMAIVIPGLVLVPPHSMFYDAGLLVLALAWLAAEQGRRSLPALVVLQCVGWSAVWNDSLGWNPLFLVALATLVWAVYRLASTAKLRS